MALSWENLKDYVNAGYESDASIERYWNLAKAMVDKYVGIRVIPVTVLDEAYLQVAAELFDRSQTPNSGQYTEAGGVQLRVTRDPLKPAYGLLKRYVAQF